METSPEKKYLCVWYSRDGHIKRIVEAMKDEMKLNMDMVRIIDHEEAYGKGFFGFLRAGKDARKGKSEIEIEPEEVNWEEYDKIVLASPIWNWSLNPLMSTFCTKFRTNVNKIPAYAVVSSAKGSEPDPVLNGLKEILGRECALNIHLVNDQQKEFEKVALPLVREFVEKLR